MTGFQDVIPKEPVRATGQDSPALCSTLLIAIVTFHASSICSGVLLLRHQDRVVDLVSDRVQGVGQDHAHHHFDQRGK